VLDKIILTSFNYSASLCCCSKYNYNTYFVVYITFGCMLKRQSTWSCEEYYLLGSQPTFWSNILHPSSGSNKLSKISTWKQVASREADSILLPPAFMQYLALLIHPWRWGWHVSLKGQLTLNRLHRVISQKIVLFITTTVRISNPTYMIIYI
jgi:hypothetical protein